MTRQHHTESRIKIRLMFPRSDELKWRLQNSETKQSFGDIAQVGMQVGYPIGSCGSNYYFICCTSFTRWRRNLVDFLEFWVDRQNSRVLIP
jgi:hypothetical protein